MWAGHWFRFGRLMLLACICCAVICVSCQPVALEPSPDLAPPEPPDPAVDADIVDPASIDPPDPLTSGQDNADDSSEDDGPSDPPEDSVDLPLIIIDDEPEQEAESENRPPRADAGRDLFVEEGARVELDGSESEDPGGDELSHVWRQVSGPRVLLDRDEGPLISFTAPQVDEDSALTFRLTVSDGVQETSDNVDVLVANLLDAAAVEVTADAGSDQEVQAGDVVELDGSGSFGAGEGPLEFFWSQRSGPPVSLSANDRPIVTFTAPPNLEAPETLVFELRVTQADGVDSGRVDILVRASLEGSDPPGGDGGGGGDDPPPECSADADCVDGLFCNGDESCEDGQCSGGVAPCGEGLCDELTDECVDCASDSDCDNGVFCDGEEVCTGGECEEGENPCAERFCEELSQECVDCRSDADCDDGLFCNGTERCDAGACVAGDDPCPDRFCEESDDACADCLADSDCDDGLFCNGEERCSDGACQTGDDPCDGGACDENADACTGLDCDGEDPPFENGVQAGTLLGSDVDEASGMVASRQNPGVLWTHNDDGGDNRLFAINTGGTLLGTYTVGSGARDPEDIAIGPGPESGVDYLYWGDIGDNDNVRSSIFVKRVPEPPVDANQDPISVELSGVDVIRLQYPTGDDAPSHKDAETLLIDPLNGDLYVVTKRTSRNRVYRAAYPQSISETTTLTFVAETDWGGSTGGDVSPDGTLIVIRQYTGRSPEASVWQRPAGGNFWDAFAGDQCDLDLRSEPQGESICFDRDGLGLYTVSENQSQGAEIPIWYYARNGG